MQAQRRAELTQRRTTVFLAASVAVVAGLYVGYRCNVLNLADSSDSSSSSNDSTSARNGNTTGSGLLQSRRNIGAYMRGLFHSWSR